MIRSFFLISVLLSVVGLTSYRDLFALEPPVVLDPAVVMVPFSNKRDRSDIRFLSQPAKNEIIDLTAANGFFDRCFQAMEPGPAIEGDRRFIGPTFGYLKRGSDQVAGTARWHLWFAEAGDVKATFHMTVPQNEAGHAWQIGLGDETQTITANASETSSAQKQTLVFKVKQRGQTIFSIDCTKSPPPAESQLHFIRLEGTAVTRAALLRTRWRPAAVHAHFYAPSECPDPNMWVFETRSVSKTSSYSPLTTGFGYFGTLFNGDGKIGAGAGFNFSMWAVGRNANAAPPLAQMPRLIGTDIPEAKYATFGGEGTGVKFRDATAYPDGAERTIQALRIEPTADGLMTYYGYYYDERIGRWKLYASAQIPPKLAKAAQNPNFGTLRGTGSFCEIPGPPDREQWRPRS